MSLSTSFCFHFARTLCGAQDAPTKFIWRHRFAKNFRNKVVLPFLVCSL